MNKVDSYRFGRIVIDGRQYSSDVIIFPDRVQGAWRRGRSHEINLEDIAAILSEKPQALIVGSGAVGMVNVLPEVQRSLESQGIELVIEPTDEACNVYNRLSGMKKVVAALHLTC